jgi:hypothetical protein
MNIFTSLGDHTKNIATYDLLEHISCANMIQYADDINLSVIADDNEDLERKVDVTMEEIQIWCEKKILILNPKKSGFILISKNVNSQYELNVQLCGHKVRNDCTKVLGITIQNDLKWDEHVKYLMKKVNTVNFAIYSIRDSISREAILFIYYSYVYSFLTFGIMFWGTENKNLYDMFLL